MIYALFGALLGVILGGIAGAGACHVYLRRQDRRNLDSAESRAREMVNQAEKNAENVLKSAELKAKDEFFQKREEFNREVEQIRNEQRDQERRLEKKEDTLEQKHQLLVKKERQLQHTEKKLHERKENLEKKTLEAEEVLSKQAARLQETGGVPRDGAERRLRGGGERGRADAAPRRIQKHDEELKTTTEERARRVLAVAIQRYAAEHTADTT